MTFVICSNCASYFLPSFPATPKFLPCQGKTPDLEGNHPLGTEPYHLLVCFSSPRAFPAAHLTNFSGFFALSDLKIRGFSSVFIYGIFRAYGISKMPKASILKLAFFFKNKLQIFSTQFSYLKYRL